MKKKPVQKKSVIILASILVVIALTAGALYAQGIPLRPNGSEILHLQRIQELQLELTRLRVQLVACHDELETAREQLAELEDRCGMKAEPTKKESDSKAKEEPSKK